MNLYFIYMISKHIYHLVIIPVVFSVFCTCNNASAQDGINSSLTVSEVWSPDNGNGTYTNPVIHADYSDPDVIRVDSDYYMTASSFNCIPGLPLLHSRDLVNWELMGYALNKLPPYEKYSAVCHGCGVWAPCIRYFNKRYYIIFPDPDHGIYMISAGTPSGPWSDPVIIKEGKGLIDPSPLWDDDGKAYLVYAFAGSRAGTKSVLMVCSMKPDATATYDNDVVVFDGHEEHPTVEGPKFYKREGKYYIFAPAGGVTAGWQLVLRSDNVLGPYEYKVVMRQGSTAINGPHQGAWVSTVAGEDWFIHFQDKDAYGRVVHLNPLVWKDGWPVIGIDPDGDGCGEPVTTFRKPDVGRSYTVVTPPGSDEFNDPVQGVQWQWHANKQLTWGYPSGNMGFFRLNCIPKPDGFRNLWDIPNLMLQKFTAEEFTATTKMTFRANFDNEEAGLVIMGSDYATLSVRSESGKNHLCLTRCIDADKGAEILRSDPVTLESDTVWLRVSVSQGAMCQFSYSTDGVTYFTFRQSFTARPGRWIGAKIGFFALRDGFINDAGYADIDWFRIEKHQPVTVTNLSNMKIDE